MLDFLVDSKGTKEFMFVFLATIGTGTVIYILVRYAAIPIVKKMHIHKDIIILLAASSILGGLAGVLPTIITLEYMPKLYEPSLMLVVPITAATSSFITYKFLRVWLA